MIPGTSNGTISPKNGSPMKSGGGNQASEISGNQLGLFDLTSNSNGSTTSASEVNRLKEELLANRQRMASWEEALQRALKEREMWKNEATMAARKAESAVREKEAAMLKLAQMQKEIDTLSGGPYLHAIRRVQDLKSVPMGALKTLDWQLRKDLQEVEKAMRVYQTLDSNPWHNSVGGNNRLFDFPGVSSSANDWGMGLFATQQSLYGSLAQQ